MVIFLLNRGIKKYISNHNCTIIMGYSKFISTSRTFLQLPNKLYKKNNESDNNIKDKIVYNSEIKTSNGPFFKNFDLQLKEKEEMIKFKREGAPVIALKYFTEDYLNDNSSSNQHTSDQDNTCQEAQSQEINLPFKRFDDVKVDLTNITDVQEVYESNLCDSNDSHSTTFSTVRDKICIRPKKKWMNDYNTYAEVSVKEEEEEDDEETESAEVNYGSADPKIPTSSVPCGGCGAHLHCQDPSIPGYLPKEIFAGLKPQQLLALVCQRCHFLREYDTALSVTVDPAIYPQLLSKIREQKALVILVVDMTDFPCSIWPGILDIIGPKRPLIVVGNKVDLLQDWSKDMLHRAKQALEAQIPHRANVLHTALVSAKTGFGIETLITTLYNTWEYRGDVYLVGCTNVGKSMLFNALLQSDYCKTRAVDLVQRATTAPWPGTTLNLLKFPITRPQGWRLAVRSTRLKEESLKDLRIMQETNVQTTPQMISRISRTFAHGNTDKFSDNYWDDPFAMPKMETLRRIRTPGSGLDPEDPVLANSKWLYDTPGVITADQIIDLLTTEELLLTLPQKALIPRTFKLFTGQTLMIGGLGRIDYISGSASIRMTVLAAATLPVTICLTVDAEEVYNHYLGTPALAVPCGSVERLCVWPGLRAAKQCTLKGNGWKESCCDVVLSSAGWVAVTAGHENVVRLQPWTPDARGAHVRIPPVLPCAVRLKGQRMFKSPAYALFNDHMKNVRRR